VKFWTTDPIGCHSYRAGDRDNPPEETVAGSDEKDTVRRETGNPHTAAIDMRLFRIPLGQLEPNRHYQVRLKGRRTWKRAFRWGKLWLADGDLVGRVEDTAEIRPSEQEVMTAIDRVAETMANPLEDRDGPGLKQSYVDRDVLDESNTLLGGNGPRPEHPSRQQIAVYRAVRLAAAAKAIPSTPYFEIAVGYCVADNAENNVFESPELEEAILYAQDTEGLCSKDVGVVFADGSVRYGHELFLRPWIKDRAR
jgi:hypothetical protein